MSGPRGEVHTPPDIERQLDWLLKGTLNMMAVDVGTADFELIIDGLAQLSDMLARRAVALPELLAYGVWSRERIMRVARVWNANIVIASQRPSILANQGHAVTEGATETFAPDITRDALRPINLASFAIHVDEAINTARAGDSAQLEGFATASRGVA